MTQKIDTSPAALRCAKGLMKIAVLRKNGYKI
jgi:hypothetical protein